MIDKIDDYTSPLAACVVPPVLKCYNNWPPGSQLPDEYKFDSPMFYESSM